MSVYSREVQITLPSGAFAYEELPFPMQGILDRFTITKVSGAITTLEATLYNRLGACFGGIDRHCSGGGISAVADNGSGKVRLTTDADHELRIGDTLLLKDTGTALDLEVGTVTAVPDTDIVDLDLDHVAVASGYWQTEPEIESFALLPAAAYVVYSTSSLPDAQHNMDREYCNRDNQSLTARRRHSALYLECNPSHKGVIVVSYSVKYDD